VILNDSLPKECRSSTAAEEEGHWQLVNYCNQNLAWK